MIKNNTLFLLEFHKLLSVISGFAHSEGTKEAVVEHTPFSKAGRRSKDVSARSGRSAEYPRKTMR